MSEFDLTLSEEVLSSFSGNNLLTGTISWFREEDVRQYFLGELVVDSGKILGYFIEEAKEHLTTIEQGLLDLHSIMDDEERVRELFRAAHSVKGGAAMLGYISIQKTAHNLEDCFKLLQEHPVKVDRQLESLFFNVYDTLHGLVSSLEGPYGLREEEATKVVQEAEPKFIQLHEYLGKLLDSETVFEVPPTEVVTSNQTQHVNGKAATTATVQSSTNITAQITAILKEMLELFKQQETKTNRQQLIELCKRLIQIEAGADTWSTLIKISAKAIMNPNNTYRHLAPILIKEIKQASELLVVGKVVAIAPSQPLLQLAATPATAPKPAPTATPAAAQPPATPKQITITVEPKEAAKALVKAFNKQQLTQLVTLLQRVIA